MLNYLAVFNLNHGHRLERLPDGAHQTLVPSQSFPTQDGYIVIMCMKEKFWQRLAERMGVAYLIEEARFRTFQDRLTHRTELIAILTSVMQTKTTAQWLERFRGHVPCAPVYTVAEALADEHVQAREMVIDVAHPQFGRLREVGCPIKIDDVRPQYQAASALGGDTDELLRTLLGLSDAEIANARAAGAIG